MEEHLNIKVLFEKYTNKTIDADELLLLNAYFKTDENQGQLDGMLEEYFLTPVPVQELHEKAGTVESAAWNGIQESLGMQKPSIVNIAKNNSWMIKLAAAAAVLLILSVFTYFIQKPGSVLRPGSNDYSNDVQPGRNRATLVSSKGIVYHLNGAKGEIITEKGSIRYKDGALVENQQPDQSVTLSTPRGGQYRVTLSDGTKVWLNAASSLTYPVNFNGKDRRVELTGEAYFEVAHNAAQPFIVHTDGQQVKVLGTSFNLNAYKEEHKTVTTLVNGRVQLSGNGNIEAQELHPGEQAVLQKSVFNIAEVDAAMFGAWKDGQFRFRATPLIEALRQIERWYDLDVDYTGIPADIQIHASISRDKKLSTVILALEKITDLKFDVKGRSIKLMQ